MLVLVRHAETAANAEGRLLGRAESPLTEHGRAQAAELAKLVGEVTRLVSSPLERARETARSLAPGLEVETDDRWIEVDYGDYEGRHLSEIPRAEWDKWRRNAAERWPGGESLADVGRRVRDACEELFAEGPAGALGASNVVVVSHVSPIKAAVAWALGTGDRVAWRLQLSTASVTRIGCGVAGPLLFSYNETVR